MSGPRLSGRPGPSSTEIAHLNNRARTRRRIIDGQLPAPPVGRSLLGFVRVWGTVGALLIIVGALSRTDFSCSWSTLILMDSWPGKLPEIWGRILPLALGLASLVTLWIRPDRISGIAVASPVMAALLAYSAASLFSQGRGALLAMLEILLGASLVVAGSHETRIFPDRKLPRALAGIGGMVLFMPFFLRDADMLERRTLELLVYDTIRERAWGAPLVAWLLLILGVFGLCVPSARPPSKGWTRCVSVTCHLLLLAFPFALYQSWWDRNSGYAVLVLQKGDPLYAAWMQNWDERDLMFKFWLLGSGHAILLSTGIAAWVEDILRRQPVLPASPAGPLAQVPQP